MSALHLDNLLGLQHQPVHVLHALLDRARDMREAVRLGGSLDTHRGKTAALLFMENSTRTRASFEMAAVRLGMHPLVLPAHTSSAKKGESLEDTARLLAAVGSDVLILRHGEVGAHARVAKVLDIPVVNAGEGTAEHPTQALLDALTLLDRLDHLGGRVVTIVGDVRHSRVARSNCFALSKLGASVRLCGPPALCPSSLQDELAVTVSHDFDAALDGADAVMMLRIQRERIEPGLLPDHAAYVRDWQLDRARLERHPSVVAVLHPAPMNRGVEITSEVADGPRSVVFDQMANGVPVRMAVLDSVVGERGRDGRPLPG